MMAGKVLEVWQRTACRLRHVMQSVQMTDRLIFSPTVSMSMLHVLNGRQETQVCGVLTLVTFFQWTVDFIESSNQGTCLPLDKLSIKHAGSLQPCPKRGGVFSFPENMEFVFILCSWLAQLDPDGSSRYC